MLLIENKTILLPEIIAEGAIWEVLDKHLKSMPPEQCYELQEEIKPQLVERANRHYNNNKFFRSHITSDERGRNALWAFMGHWTESILHKKKLI